MKHLDDPTRMAIIKRIMYRDNWTPDRQGVMKLVLSIEKPTGRMFTKLYRWLPLHWYLEFEEHMGKQPRWWTPDGTSR